MAHVIAWTVLTYGLEASYLGAIAEQSKTIFFAGSEALTNKDLLTVFETVVTDVQDLEQGSAATQAAKERVQQTLRTLLIGVRPIIFAFFTEVIAPYVLATLNGQQLQKDRLRVKGKGKGKGKFTGYNRVDATTLGGLLQSFFPSGPSPVLTICTLDPWGTHRNDVQIADVVPALPTGDISRDDASAILFFPPAYAKGFQAKWLLTGEAALQADAAIGAETRQEDRARTPIGFDDGHLLEISALITNDGRSSVDLLTAIEVSIAGMITYALRSQYPNSTARDVHIITIQVRCPSPADCSSRWDPPRTRKQAKTSNVAILAALTSPEETNVHFYGRNMPAQVDTTQIIYPAPKPTEELDGPHALHYSGNEGAQGRLAPNCLRSPPRGMDHQPQNNAGLGIILMRLGFPSTLRT